jgi:hypothetical protein
MSVSERSHESRADYASKLWPLTKVIRATARAAVNDLGGSRLAIGMYLNMLQETLKTVNSDALSRHTFPQLRPSV